MIINKRLYRNFILNRIFANTEKFNPLEIPYISNNALANKCHVVKELKSTPAAENIKPITLM